MSIKETQKERQARKTRDNIIETAVELFRTYSLDKVSMRDIASNAGVTTGALYHHFSSKEDLLKAIGLDKKTHIDKLASKARGHGNHIESLLFFIGEFVSGEIKTHGDKIKEYRLTRRSPQQEDVNAVINPLPKAVAQFISEAQAAGELDDKWAVSDIVSSVLREVWGIHYDYSVAEEKFNITEMLNSRIPDVLRSYMPGSYEKRNWWQSQSANF